MKRKLKFNLVHILANSIILLAIALIIFAFYKLTAYSGLSIILAIVIALLLVFVIAYCLKEASDKLIVKEQPKIKPLTQGRISKWVEKRYQLLTLFVSLGLSSAVGLVCLGIMLVCIGIFAQVKNMPEIILGSFGLVVFSLGVYFIVVVIHELRFILKNKTDMLARIFKQIKFP